MWGEWRSCLPENCPPPPPHRPPAWNEAEAQAATDALIRALNALQPTPPLAAAQAMPAGAVPPSYTSVAPAARDRPQLQRCCRREEDRLRRLLKVHAGEHPRDRFRQTILGSEVHGIWWPLPSDCEADPIATLRGDCAAAFHALDKPTPPNVVGRIPAYRAVVRTLPVLAEAVARLLSKPAPMFPPDTQNEEAARRYVEAALDWCENKAVPLADARAASHQSRGEDAGGNRASEECNGQ